MANYEKAGVNRGAANESVKKIGFFVKKTFNKNVFGGFGSFSGAVDVSFLKKYKRPILVSTIDGVGTKVKIAKLRNKWGTVGQDIANHCSNDLLACGGKPLFFLDYIASSKINPRRIAEIVKGMSIACKKLDCPIIGGETAEMPGVYESGETDIAGCMVGVVDAPNFIDGKKIRAGDVLVGLASSGLHTNGYSLARNVLLKKKLDKKTARSVYTRYVSRLRRDNNIQYTLEYNKKILNDLLAVHKSYSKNVLDLMKQVEVKGIVHVTGGGFIENIPRILPRGVGVLVDKSAWRVPKIFQAIQKKGNVSWQEMFRVFNMGIGLVLVVKESDAKKAVGFLAKRKEKALKIGKAIKQREGRVLFHG